MIGSRWVIRGDCRLDSGVFSIYSSGVSYSSTRFFGELDFAFTLDSILIAQRNLGRSSRKYPIKMTNNSNGHAFELFAMEDFSSKKSDLTGRCWSK